MVKKSLKGYFWDTEINALDIKIHKQFIIERILEYGDEEALRWLFDTFSSSDVVAALRISRRLSPKSKNYWGIKLKVWKNGPPSARTRETIWQF